MMYQQNNMRWKNASINNSKVETIGSVGCLLTSLCNIHNAKYNDDMTPPDLNDKLIMNNGYTNGNLIIWSVVEHILKCSIKHYYEGEVEYDMNSYYIVNFLHFGTGHFTNLLNKKEDRYNIYDVWDGKRYAIPKPRRIVKVTYND